MYVSANPEPDILRLNFVDKYMFVSQNDLPIDLGAAEMSMSRRRQLSLHADKNHLADYYGYDDDSPQILTLEREMPAQLQYGTSARTI